MMGRAITCGMVPYRDYFDLKGPVFFFIEAIGQMFCHGRVGIFIIECIASAISCIFIYKICRLYIRPWQAYIVLLLTGFVAVSPFWGGNTCEEYMLPFNYACIYLALKYIKEKNYEQYFIPSLIFGISFAVMALSKVPTCAPMFAASLTVVIELVMKKKAGYIPAMIGYFFLGVAMIFIPVCAYFIFHGAFKDFIYAAFVFAYKRGTDYYETFSWEWEMKLIICYALFIGTMIIPTKKSKEHYFRIFGFLLSFVTWAFLHLGTPYDYYFLLTMPCFVYLVMSLFAHWNNRCMLDPDFEGRPDLKRIVIQRRVLWAVLILLVCLHYYPDTKFKFEENKGIYEREEDWYVEACKDVLNVIPFSEINNIYDLESGMIFYEVNQLLPANCYPVNLPYFMHLNPQIKADVLQYLDVIQPKYIISEDMASFDDEDTVNYVFSHYVLLEDLEAEEIYIRVE